MSADLPSPPPDPNLPSGGGLSPGDASAKAGADPPEFPRQKRRFRQHADEDMVSHDQQIFVLSTLLASLMEKRNAKTVPLREYKVRRFRNMRSSGEDAAVPPPPSARELRTDTSAASREASAEIAADAPSPSADAADAASTLPDAAKTEAGAAAKVPWPFWREPTEDRVRRQPLRYLNWLLTIAAVVLAFVGGRQTSSIPLFSQPAQGSEAPAMPAPLTWSEEDLAQLDRILAADQAGDLDAADQIAKSLKVVAGPLPGLETYLGTLVARRQKYADAQSMLNRLVTPAVFGAQLAAIDNAMGFTYTRQRHFSQASQEFKHSTRAEPFAADSFRLWAESLRREGRMPEAIAEFKQALDRYPIGSLEYVGNREYVEYKIRLSQIEGGLPVDSRKETADRIATADSTGYWFLTDAAAALQQGDDQTATGALQKAKDSLPGPLFEMLLADYFFRNYSTREDLAAFFPAEPNSPVQNLKSRMVYFIDP